jgi:hypothetical protein
MNPSSIGITDNTVYAYLAKSDNDSKSAHLYSLLTKLQSHKNVRLDIYFLNDASRSEIVDWVNKNKVAEFLHDKLATVNFKGKFVESLTKKMKQNLVSGSLIKDSHGLYRVMNWGDING